MYIGLKKIIICRTDLPGYFKDVQHIELDPPGDGSPGGRFDDLLTDAALRGRGQRLHSSLCRAVSNVLVFLSLYRILRFILVDGATSKQFKTDLSDLKWCCFFYVSTLYMFYSGV